MSWYDQVTNPPIYKTLYDAQAPRGFAESSTFHITKSKSARPLSNRQQITDLKIKKGWEIAMAPVKSLPMTLFMNYMTGNSLQIISISMTLMLFVTPIKAIFNINETFEFLAKGDDEGNTSQDSNYNYDNLLIKLAFVAAQLLSVGVGLWKLNNMGLIPNSTSDWLSWEQYPAFAEKSLGIF